MVDDGHGIWCIDTRWNIINYNQLVMWNVGFGGVGSRDRCNNQPQFGRMNWKVQPAQHYN
eukprot:scaffold9665_cov41-Cyclotella_meneghiniana.AAC.1